MLVQLDSNTGTRDFTATSTGLPINPANLPRTRGPLPAVAVLGHPGRVAGLAAHLPHGWSLRRAAGLEDVLSGEIVLFAGATEREIATARRVLASRTTIVAVVDEVAPAELVAAVLTAGADACVRSGQPAILAGHLVACRRRDLTGRWSGLNIQGRR
ncbi:hypothetical protein [Paractinoplanes brasiliensis]|uniref:Uncharacterized protein n=1 Tax=Paractinoplanes brasiliensis TaxID=52695 RepID=A0A4R6K063_9ACTN|nr:hypothetical protein [Actinoplanes brasiliensis]TDO42550.1 hypothetical protein C8E87_6323 [Actinoplanes brasiliensis]GID31345.1 hypothetical protein Abr02nite_63280 [Actinoplanes brasiliensis]